MHLLVANAPRYREGIKFLKSNHLDRLDYKVNAYYCQFENSPPGCGVDKGFTLYLQKG